MFVPASNRASNGRVTHAATADELPPQLFQDVLWSKWAIHAPSVASQSAIGAAICRQTTPSAAMLSKIAPVIAREIYAAEKECRSARGRASTETNIEKEPYKKRSPKKT